MQDTAVIISPNYKDYADKYLLDCIASLRQQDCIARCKIFIVDNASTEASRELLIKIAPEAELLHNSDNAGFAKGNNVAMKAAISLGLKYLVLINMDTILDLRAISQLIIEAESNDDVGGVQSRLMLWPAMTKVNSLGNATHFLGFGFSLFYNIEYDDLKSAPNREIFYPSGAAVLYKASVLKEIGLFDEELWMYAEDQDMGWLMWLAGYKCHLAINSIVYHKYEFSRSIQKYYWMDRNRIILLFKNLKIATLIIILPALFIMELGLIFFAIKNNSIKQKFEVYRYFLKASTWSYILKARTLAQSKRKIKDKKITDMMKSVIEYQEIASTPLVLANYFFTLYWWLASKLIVW
ncbi:MAG: glycosyltransferase family 2 protein [bacterium]